MKISPNTNNLIIIKSYKEKIRHLKIKVPVYFIQIFSKIKNYKIDQKNSKF